MFMLESVVYSQMKDQVAKQVSADIRAFTAKIPRKGAVPAADKERMPQKTDTMV